MKWIGKHIVDFIARFRSDVYLDSVPTGTIIGGGNLGLDLNNKIVRSTVTGGGSGDETTDNAIEITNADPAFGHITSPIGAGTTFTDVFELILNPYVQTSVSLDSVTLTKETSTSTYGNPTGVTSSQDLHVGQKFKLTQVRYSVTDASKTKDTGIDFKINESDIQTGLADSTTTAQDLTSAGIVNSTVDDLSVGAYGDNYGLHVTAQDEDTSFPDIDSNYIYIKVRNYFKVGGYATSSVTSDAEAKTLWEALGDGVTGSGLTSKQTKTFTTDNAIDTQYNYTWIIYPSKWGDISSIKQDDSYGVLVDFSAPVTFNIENEFGASEAYELYRSKDDDAFANGTTLQVKF